MITTLTLNPALDRELTVPAIEFDAVLRATASRADFGGKGFNVSRMIHSLGGETLAMGFAGGRTGETLRDGLEGLGIETDFVWVDDETRTNVSIVTPAGDRYIKVNEAGPTIDDAARDALLERLRARARPGEWWVLGGSLPPGLPSDFYATLVTLLREAGARVLLDTSGEPLRAGIAARPHLIKPNEVEAAQLSGRPVTTPDEAREAAQGIEGVERVAISLGARGALLVEGKRGWVADAPRIDAKNPIGAGDSLVAGMVWALDRGDPPEETLRWGIACGAATASLAGTAVGSREQVERLARQVGVREIDPAAG